MTSWKYVRRLAAPVAAALFSTACPALAADTPEVEPNETKAQATPVAASMVTGDTLSGITTGASTTVPGAASADTFRVKTAPAALGIYRHRLQLGATGNGATIRGLNQTDGPTGGVIGATDTTVQTSSTTTATPRIVQWYGFGKEEEIYYRVTGATTSPAYIATLTTDALTATDIGTFQPGQIVITTISQGHTTDTDLWVYDANLDAIPTNGNDDESIAGGGGGTTLQSRLTRNYGAGTYYLALGTFQTANNQASPEDDDFETGSVLDFPNAIANSSTTANVNVAFAVIDNAGTTPIAATRVDAYGIEWFKFQVAVPPPFGACCFADGTCVDNQSSADCATAGGSYSGDGSDCSPNTCPQPGACCQNDGSCLVQSAGQCATAGGVYRGNGTACDGSSCVGRCCFEDGSCLVNSPADCATAGGTYGGNGTNCTPNTCAQPGACCVGSTCSQLTQATCTLQGGAFRGAGSSCTPNPCVGGCCLPDATCQTVTSSDCAGLSGIYLGNGTDCTGAVCTGACCLPDETCTENTSSGACATAGGTFRGPGSACTGCAETDEVEPNDNKGQATPTGAVDVGHRLLGTTTGTSTTIPGGASADYFKITTSTAPLAIYRWRLLNTGATTNTSAIRGSTQTAGVPNAGTDTALQTSSTASNPIRHLQWYGFGKGEMLYVSITGAATTTAPYEYTLERATVTPNDIPGNFVPGSITITSVGQTTIDTDMWVYDSALNAIVDYGNDDEGGGTTLQSRLIRSYVAGTYYLAMGDFNLANNLGSPVDDDFRTGTVLDFPDVLAVSDRDAIGLDLDFTVTDSAGTTVVANPLNEGDFQIPWFKFIVGNPCPGPRGDANCDTSVDFFDIDPFLLALFDLPLYQSTFCGGSICTVDVDCSGGVDFFDIDPFLTCLFGACTPCP